ncbi:hypothetical protein [Streptomyces varsoviensis]|uniref:RDD family protein n=1 Tax=Streptomyces varsoviensis TaxID=67373 RepID=A0ABR5J0J0_9ACTN|nr:hypothetical protein [Streptomyces varsoviensis]KOG86925.1 hypothetical protein ADK38_28290 [Streptomyces varsoviensis]
MRSQAAADAVAPAPLPFLGTSWYRRGLGYWTRRAAMVGGLLLGLLLLGAVMTAVYRGIVAGLPPAPRLLCDIAQAVACCVCLVWGWKSARGQVLRQRLDPPAPEQAWQRRRAESRRGTALAVGGRVVALVAMPVLPAAVAYLIGMVCAGMFVRELPIEIGARRALAEARRA